MNLDELNKDIFNALITNSKDLGDWLATIGEVNPYQALMTFDKLTATLVRITEMGLTGKSEDGFNITIEVESEAGKKVLTELLKEDQSNEDKDDKSI